MSGGYIFPGYWWAIEGEVPARYDGEGIFVKPNGSRPPPGKVRTFAVNLNGMELYFPEETCRQWVDAMQYFLARQPPEATAIDGGGEP